MRIESGESEGERLLAAGGMLGFLSHCHPEFISGSSEKGKSKEERVKREGGRWIAWLSHLTETTAVIRYPCDREPLTVREYFGLSWDVRNGKR